MAAKDIPQVNIHAVIGKNFGDEGKGLAVDYFAGQARESGASCLAIRHNGGAQAGHTVDLPDGRFVFHQLSSGSFRGADTLWAETFLPDLYKLSEEIDAFSHMAGFTPGLYAEEACRCVYIDDVLLNMALESARGPSRHGSCGMGINEAVERSKHPEACISLGALKAMSAERLYAVLKQIRGDYVPVRMRELGLRADAIGEYGELLRSDTVLYNAAEAMCRGAASVCILDCGRAAEYGAVIFEGAQGLLLDEKYERYAPHLTSSKTGAHNPAAFCRKYLPGQSVELVYVTRTYVTRHGNGPLPYALPDTFGQRFADKTNMPNPWQGKLRFARHGSRGDFAAPVLEDTSGIDIPHTVSLMVTHLNETSGCICAENGNIPLDDWIEGNEISACFSSVYVSDTPYSKDIVRASKVKMP